MVFIEYDKVRGIVTCHSKGLFTVAQADAGIKLAKIASEECMADWGDVKILVISDGQLQSDEVNARYKRGFAAYSRHPRTRIALVMPTSLLKLLVSKVIEVPVTKCFISEHAALTWLLAEREGRTGVQGIAAG